MNKENWYRIVLPEGRLLERSEIAVGHFKDEDGRRTGGSAALEGESRSQNASLPPSFLPSPTLPLCGRRVQALCCAGVCILISPLILQDGCYHGAISEPSPGIRHCIHCLKWSQVAEREVERQCWWERGLSNLNLEMTGALRLLEAGVGSGVPDWWEAGEEGAVQGR